MRLIMLVTNHVLSGAALGALLPGPVTAFTVGVASHFALDAVPHWGARPLEEVLHVARRDGVTGLVVIAVLTAASPSSRRLAVMAGMAGAAFPDLDKPSRHFFGRSCFPWRVDWFHSRIQREAQHRMPQEIVVGLALLPVALGLVRRR